MSAAKPVPSRTPRPPAGRRSALFPPVRGLTGTRRQPNRSSGPPAKRLGPPGRSDRPARPRRPGHRAVAAGQILGVGLVCFGLWLFLDARQLYNNALASPPGARRTASMDFLGPIARVEEVFGVDRIVDGANRSLGRATSSDQQVLPTLPPATPGTSAGSGGPSAPGSSPAPPAASGPTAPGTGVGVLLRPALGPFLLTPSVPAGVGVVVGPPRPDLFTLPVFPVNPVAPAGASSASTGPAKSALPPLSSPTPAHPLSVLEVGDSLGVDLGYGLEDVLGNQASIHLQTRAVIDTGLANVAYYNWPATLAQDLRRYHPGLVLVMVGGNDTQNFAVGNRAAQFGSAFWRQQYGLRVQLMMREAVASRARVVWVGMPQMAPGAPVTSAQMAQLDSIYAAQAAKVPGVLYVPTWSVLANSKGAYSTFIPDHSGALVAVRDPDGVHIDYPAGDDLVANAIVSAVHKAWSVKL